MRLGLCVLITCIICFSCNENKVNSPYDIPGTYLYVSHHPNGQIHTSVQLIHYKQDGLLRMFYPNGRLKLSRYWVNGNRKGDTRFYDSTGSLLLHTEKKFKINQGLQRYGTYEYVRDTVHFPNNEDVFNQLPLENLTVVVPDVLEKLDSLVEIIPSTIPSKDGNHYYTILIPNVPFTTLRLSTTSGIVRSASQLDCGYQRIDKVFGRCFELIPNDSITTMDLKISAVINQQEIQFTTRRIEVVQKTPAT